MIFHTPFRSREHCPVIRRDALGRQIELSDQSGVMRLLPGDRVRIVEDRGDWCLCEHSACTLGLLLIARAALHDEPDAAPQPATVEDSQL